MNHASFPAIVLFALFALIGLGTTLAACDSVTADPTPLPTLSPLSEEATARVTEVFAAAEELYTQGTATLGKQRVDLAALLALTPAEARAAFMADTVRFTGIYDPVHGRGFLATVRYRRPLGAELWQVTLQAGRSLPSDKFGVETLAASFYTFSDLSSFLAAVQAGQNPYLAGTSDNPAGAFTALDEWRLSRLYSPSAGEAVVTYTTDGLAEQYTLRDPVVTVAANNTCTVRDGGLDGSVRTRYYESDCVVAADGAVSGTLSRTLTTTGNASGAVTSRTDFATGAWRLVTQRGGDGVVVRTTDEG